jgi:hypothetical protein
VTAPSIPTQEEFRRRGPVWEAGWRAGVEAEAACRNEDMSPAARSVRATLEAFAKLRPEATEHDIALTLFSIFVEGWWRKSRLRLRAGDLRRRLRRLVCR